MGDISTPKFLTPYNAHIERLQLIYGYAFWLVSLLIVAIGDLTRPL